MYKIIIVVISIYLSAGLQVGFSQTSWLAGLQPLGWLAIALWLSRGEDQEWVRFVYVVAVSCLFGLITNTNLGLLALALVSTVIVWHGMRRIVDIQLENLGQILLFFNIWLLLWLLFGHQGLSLKEYLVFVIVNSGFSYLYFSVIRVLTSWGQHGVVRLR